VRHTSPSPPFNPSTVKYSCARASLSLSLYLSWSIPITQRSTHGRADTNVNERDKESSSSSSSKRKCSNGRSIDALDKTRTAKYARGIRIIEADGVPLRQRLNHTASVCSSCNVNIPCTSPLLIWWSLSQDGDNNTEEAFDRQRSSGLTTDRNIRNISDI
jgi:hypothetical protein